MNILDKIKTEKFIISIGHELPARAMHRLFSRFKECRQFREEYESGVITDYELRSYVSILMLHLTIGEKFKYDMTLALIAVGLEKYNSEFANEYLSDLATLNLAELPLSIDISNICLKNREKQPVNKYKKFSWIYDDIDKDAFYLDYSFKEFKYARVEAEKQDEKFKYNEVA